MYFKIRKYNSVSWKFVENISAYDAIQKEFGEHTLFFCMQEHFSIYINPETQEKFLVEQIKKIKKNNKE
jgi:hypothetical protein